ncbi:MAG: transcription termination factor Rho [Puniceicoccales bacterium]|nr:transcription termination factor Rho [Puniceicoccales bacterium]
MSDDTTMGIPYADSSADVSASQAPRKRGRPRKVRVDPTLGGGAADGIERPDREDASSSDAESAMGPAGGVAPSSASVYVPAMPAVSAASPAVSASPPAPEAQSGVLDTAAARLSPPEVVRLPVFEIAGESGSSDTTSDRRAGDAVVFDPQKIIEQFRGTAPAAPSTLAAPVALAEGSDVRSQAVERPVPAPVSSSDRFSPPVPDALSATGTGDDAEHATAADLARISDGDCFSFSPDAPETVGAPEAGVSARTSFSRPLSPPAGDAFPQAVPARGPDARSQSERGEGQAFGVPASGPVSPLAGRHPQQSQSQNGGNAPQKSFQQQPRQGGGGANPSQQHGRGRPQPFSGPAPQQQSQQKHAKGRLPPGKPQPGRQWGNITLGESVDEAPVNLGAAFDYETLNTPDGLEAMLAVAALPGEPLDFNAAYALGANDLAQFAKSLGCVWQRTPPRRGMLGLILAAAPAAKRPIFITGTVEILENGNGLLLYLHDDYRVKELSAFIPRQLIKRHGLQRGHEVRVLAAAPREGETAPIVVRVDKVMDNEPEVAAQWLPFSELTPYYPTQRIFLETDQATATWDNLSMRCVDLLCPVGLGQRGLIVAPPRTGKTVLLQGIANAVLKNTPQAHLIILLVDERPEEVTDFKRQVRQAEIVSSTFDENAESHVHAAEIVIERARRMVEAGRHVVILLDSITRLARAYNTLQPGSGKILSGGVESNALSKPKRFFGSARNIEGGGSLTILGTALVETGSKMDEVIFEEFKGTGNMELDLDRDLANKRIFPAISFERSGTRKEELLYHPDEIQKIYALRRAMKGIPSADAMEQLIQRIKKTKTNIEFLLTLGR